LIQASSKSRVVLDTGAVGALSPPQHELGVTGKLSTPREKFLVTSLLYLFVHFTLSTLPY
jgi:hypothetical protein